VPAHRFPTAGADASANIATVSAIWHGDAFWRNAVRDSQRDLCRLFSTSFDIDRVPPDRSVTKVIAGDAVTGTWARLGNEARMSLGFKSCQAHLRMSDIQNDGSLGRAFTLAINSSNEVLLET
jgi:hypothetical protein